MNIVPRVFMGPELKQETYYVEGKGWRTHHVISRTASFEREATPEEIEETKASLQQTSDHVVPDTEPDLDVDTPKKRGRPRKAE